MRELPKPYLEFLKNFPEVGSAYEHLANVCHEAGPLTAKERALVKLGISMGARLEGAVHAQVRKALAAGVQPGEIRHAVLLALTTTGFPNMMANMTWVDDQLVAAPDAKKKSKGRKRR
jgi:alkylhydroperoxidase/carboxymuconolactone decarboxylase family protein YurZ